MSNNKGQYVTYGQLLEEYRVAGNSKVTSTDVTLSNKAVDAGGDIYDINVATAKVGDVISQAGETDCVIETFSGPDKVRLEKTGAEQLIVNGGSFLLHSDEVTKKRAQDSIQTSMDFIDEKTRQFFNCRTFDDTNPVKIEGRNSPTLFLGVPIIQIDKLLINSTDTELTEGEDFDFVVYNSRSRPQDDRRNPMIKLNVGRGRDSIFIGVTNRLFIRATLTHIEGSFGFLEPNGSTPLLIQRATLKLVFKQLENPLGSSDTIGGSNVGPRKRLKVDLHEEEFFELKDVTSAASLSGDSEVDRIISTYRSVIGMGGSFKTLKSTEVGATSGNRNHIHV